jgi:hypothetical protein
VGANYAPFIPGGTGQLMRNFRLNLLPQRFGDRRELLAPFDQLKRETEMQFENFDRSQRQAYEALLRANVANALDLSKIDPRVVEQYDTSKITLPPQTPIALPNAERIPFCVEDKNHAS